MLEIIYYEFFYYTALLGFLNWENAIKLNKVLQVIKNFYHAQTVYEFKSQM